MSEKSGTSNLALFFAGLSIGALVALLVAPKSGEETRKFIAGKAEEGRDYLDAKVKGLRKQATAFVGKGADSVAKGKARFSDVVEEGKRVYHAKVAG